jgi:glycosyltransferase 2 family protein
MQKAHFRNLIKFLLFIGVGVAILGYVYVVQDKAYQEDCVLKGIKPENCSLLKKLYNDFVSSNLFYLVLVNILFFISNVSRAVRWQMMLKSIGIKARFRDSFNTIMLSYLVNLGLSRIGEFARAAALARKENLNFNKIMGTVILDRTIDVISLGIVFIITIGVSSGHLLSFIRRNNNLAEKINNFITDPKIWILVFLFLAVSVFVLKSKRFKESPIGSKVIKFIKEIIIGFKSIKNVEKPGLFVFHSVLIWFMYFLMNWAGFLAFSPTSGLGLVPAILVFTFGSLGILIPSPGGMGTYHFLVIEALNLFGVNGSDGFSYANIMFFAVQIIGVIFFGIIALLMLNLSAKEIEDELQKQNI